MRTVLTTVPAAVLARPLIDFLADNDVQAWARSDDAGGVYPPLAFVRRTVIEVDDRDAYRARQLLDAYLAAEDAP